jgi:L-threonylcarbamoyladenylate synthase
MPEVLKINPENPEINLIARAIHILKTGGVIAFPTETFYGLAADATNEDAVEKIFHLKGRDFSNPVALIIGNDRQLQGLVEEIPDSSRILMQTFWPGPLTLVFKASPQIIPKLTAHTGKIGIRISSHPVAACLANQLDRPITATSANFSGTPEILSPQEVVQCLGDRVDLVIDGGLSPGGKGSTILDVTLDPPITLREGAIPTQRIREKLLFTAATVRRLQS